MTITSVPPWRTRTDRGFTLIELLVTVMIIGLLAAIAVPVFLVQQDQVRDSVATGDLVNLRKAMVSYSLDHGGSFTTNTAALTDYGFVRSTAAAPSIVVQNDRFCAEVASDSSTTLYLTDVGTVQSGTCATSGDPDFTS